MRTYISSILVFLFLFGTAWADKFEVPKQKILGAEEPIPAGEMVLLKISEINPKPKYLEEVSYKWHVFKADGTEKTNVVFMPDGTSLFFGSGIKSTKFKAVCIATYLFVERNEKNEIVAVAARSSGLLIAEVIIGNGPDPIPPTPLPVGKYNLAQITFDLTANNISASNKKGCKSLARSFNKIAQDIQDGKFGVVSDDKSLESVLRQTKASNNDALTVDGLNKFDFDKFSSQLQEKVYELYFQNKMTTLKDFAVAWQEIALGLNAVEISGAVIEKKNK